MKPETTMEVEAWTTRPAEVRYGRSLIIWIR